METAKQERKEKKSLFYRFIHGVEVVGNKLPHPFYLFSILIVVAIIAVLVAIAIPVFNGALTKSKEAADVANVRATYAEWQTAMLTENTKAPADKDAFLKGPTGNDTLTLNYPDKLTVANGTITYTASKLTDTANDNSKVYTWTLGTPDIH